VSLFPRQPRGLALLLASPLLALTSCERLPDRVEITDKRPISEFRAAPRPGLSEEERLGINPEAPAMPAVAGPASGEGAAAPGEPPFEFDTPESWKPAPSSQMRMINFTFGPNDEGECYLTFMPGNAGGIQANLDRWRRQMGLEPFTAEELGNLAMKPFLSGEAFFVDFEGTFSGMGQAPREGYRLLGLIHEQQGLTGFAKMTGPSDLVAAEAANFDDFVASLRFRARSERSAPE